MKCCCKARSTRLLISYRKAAQIELVAETDVFGLISNLLLYQEFYRLLIALIRSMLTQHEDHSSEPYFVYLTWSHGIGELHLYIFNSFLL